METLEGIERYRRNAFKIANECVTGDLSTSMIKKFEESIGGFKITGRLPLSITSYEREDAASTMAEIYLCLTA